MAEKQHVYRVSVEWLGNRGVGTVDYASYGRDHLITAPGKPEIAGSSDPAFRGNPQRWNPEDLLLASISACHKLWYLSLCARAGVCVLTYLDDAEGTMIEAPGAGRFVRAVLRPQITIRAGDDIELAMRLHREAHANCFIANSVNFPIECEPQIMAMAPS
ncbi:OsmC family protein [Rhodovastum sp. RN2-1]|uniref:OsmC family protein n=1 Tax=Limobrevibacterium gyesilva TaxID=2991712 RepID=A0AA41YLX9_9PROT|nr:OsmC family protein [Limobrevibacterium gyesilva]MCW3474896.1 OsmC family protein [Limobrevibacterium gyesilva]